MKYKTKICKMAALFLAAVLCLGSISTSIFASEDENAEDVYTAGAVALNDSSTMDMESVGEITEETEEITEETEEITEENKENTEVEKEPTDPEKLIPEGNVSDDSTEGIIQDEVNIEESEAITESENVSEDVNSEVLINDGSALGTVAATEENITEEKDIINPLLSKNGWQQNADGTWSYYEDDTMVVNALRWITNAYYGFNSNGIMVANDWLKIDGQWYFFKADGHAAEGWIKSGSYYYYCYYGSCEMAADTFVYDGGHEYYVDGSGRMQTGWFRVSYDEYSKYYANSLGVLADGIATVDGKTYYFQHGRLNTNSLEYDAKSGQLVKTDSNGIVISTKKTDPNGWVKFENEWFYLEDGWAVHGERTLGGDTYYFTPQMLVNEVTWIYDEAVGDSFLSGFDKDGHKVINNWLKVSYDYSDYSNWYYFDSNGHAISGWKKFGSNWYYFSPEMYSDRYYETDGNKYYFNSDGLLQTNWFQKAGSDAWYHANSDGVLSSGWEQLGGDWYHFSSYDGLMETDTTIWDSSNVYRVDKDGHRVSGWYDQNNSVWYYYDPNNGDAAADGILSIGGKRYAFSMGRLLENTQIISDNKLYLIGKDGTVTDEISAPQGWKLINGSWYYGVDGAFVRNQILEIAGKKYGFNSSGKMLANTTAYLDGSIRAFNADGEMFTSGWYMNNNGAWYYFNADGSAVNGLKTFGTTTYMFDPAMRVSKKWMDGGTLYVADANGYVTAYKGANGWVNDQYYVENGKLVENGWKKISGYWYYFENAEAVRGRVKEIAGNKYYFDSSKAMATGWLSNLDYYSSENSVWSYAKSDGVLAENEWLEFSNVKYYFSGYRTLSGIHYIDGNFQLFNTDGSLRGPVSGYNKWIKNDKDWYYLNQYGNYVSGTTMEIGGKVYGFDYSGRLRKDQDPSGGFDANGVKMVSSWGKTEDGRWLYYDENGNPIQDSWKKIGGNWYYFDGFYMAIGTHKIKDAYYHFDSNGVWDGRTITYKNGWNLIDGTYYYYDSSLGLVTGWKQIGGKWYYFYSDGAMQCNGCSYIHGEYYVFGSDGSLAKNAWVKVPTSGAWYYADSNGVAYHNGLTKIGNQNYYFNYNGIMQMGSFMSGDQTVFYEVNSSGVVTNQYNAASLKGWKKLSDGSWIYSRNGAFVNGYQSIAGDYYYFSGGIMKSDYTLQNYGYFGADGKLTKTDGWVKEDGQWKYLVDGGALTGSRYIGNWYYFDYSGFAAAGIRQVDGAYYYYNGGSGGRTKMAFKEGWNQYNGKWYYCSNGSLATGLRYIGGKYYYFDYTDYDMSAEGEMVPTSLGTRYLKPDGSFLRNDWVKYGDRWYYFDDAGILLTGQWTIGGKSYYLTPLYYGMG